ncbi:MULTISPECIES: SMC-Scp complex subunit ScpB [Methanothrix]|uniref:Condensin subunit ScpB n=1 Tax=Methanothrix thermoacetophila (strain DSM 6194 / JCM 14653 / NBRC 101360 / PT) TaxID=349307 RepID=A0B6Q9_METTP|nr:MULTISPECIES: SMC-Scp complex subunit ScpB [Methanothrix]ABK14383.1 condensin subunit ScpB [Methanothrix thermoacetophila PT]
MDAKALVEAMLFAAGRPLSVEEISGLSGLDAKDVLDAANSLLREYASRGGGIEVRAVEGSFVMQVRGDLAQSVAMVAPRELDSSVIRTLAVIAYRQPIMQSELARIRGNKCYEHVRLLERMGLISASKKGRTRELRTTRGFAEYFGLQSASPEFLRGIIAGKREIIGITPIYESLARRLGIDYVIVNPYRPEDGDIAKLREVHLLIASPGYAEKIRKHYSGEIIEIGTSTFSKLKEGVEKLMLMRRDVPGAEALIREVDAALKDYRERAKGLGPVKPLTPIASEIALDMHLDVEERGVTAAADYTGENAEIIIPTHQEGHIDIIERIRQRYDAMLDGLRERHR